MSDMPLPISFADDTKKEPHCRGIQGGTDIMVKNLQQFDVAQRSGMQKQQQMGQPQLYNMQSAKSSFAQKIPVQIITLELDDAPKEKEASKTPSMNKSEDASMYPTNDISSYAVKEHTPAQVLSGLTAVLVNYSQDMDIKIDDTNNTIEGVVFVDNYYGIKFRINIWSEGDDSRFELVRTSGDAMATAKFLGDIKTEFFIEINPEKEVNAKHPEPFNVISLSLDATSMDLQTLFRQLSNNNHDLDEKEDDAITQQELDDVNESLIENDQESVDELQYLHERLKENGAIGKDIMSHEQLTQTIIDSAMKNKDICVVRGCLLILETLCQEEKIGLMLVEQYALFQNLVSLLNHEYSLIKNYSVRLLAKLSTEKKWNMDKDAAQKIKSLVESYQSSWKDSILAENGLINLDMFAQIYKKLSECN